MSINHFFQTPPSQKNARLFLRQNATRAEEILWKFIRNRQLGYKFRRQVTMLGFVADFYSHDLKLIIELDGWTHDFEKTQARDLIKQDVLERNGFEVLRFKNEQVYGDIDKLLSEIKSICQTRERALTLRPSPAGRGKIVDCTRTR